MNEQTLEQFVKQAYPVKIHFDRGDELYVAEFLDLPGCHAFGATVEEAYRNAEEAKKEWIRVAFEQGLPIPKPTRSEEPSGRILLRMPSALHSMLIDRAKMTGASLNQYMVHLLSSGVVGDHILRQVEDLRIQLARLREQIAEITANVGHPVSQATAEEQTILSFRNPVRTLEGILQNVVDTSEATVADAFVITDAASGIGFRSSQRPTRRLNKVQ